MKVDDIVDVYDGSFSMFYDGRGALSHKIGNDLRGRRFRVLAIGGQMPTEQTCSWAVPAQNDLMLCEVEAPEHVLFTQVRFCRVVDRPTSMTEKMEVTVPFGTEVVVVRILKKS